MVNSKSQIDYQCDCGIYVSAPVTFVHTDEEFESETSRIPTPFVTANQGGRKDAIKLIRFTCGHDQPIVVVRQTM